MIFYKKIKKIKVSCLSRNLSSDITDIVSSWNTNFHHSNDRVFRGFTDYGRNEFFQFEKDMFDKCVEYHRITNLPAYKAGYVTLEEDELIKNQLPEMIFSFINDLFFNETEGRISPSWVSDFFFNVSPVLPIKKNILLKLKQIDEYQKNLLDIIDNHENFSIEKKNQIINNLHQIEVDLDNIELSTVDFLCNLPKTTVRSDLLSELRLTNLDTNTISFLSDIFPQHYSSLYAHYDSFFCKFVLQWHDDMIFLVDSFSSVFSG